MLMGKYKYHHSKATPSRNTNVEVKGNGVSQINNPAVAIPGIGSVATPLMRSAGTSSGVQVIRGPIGGTLVNGLKSINFNKKGSKAPIVKLHG